MKVGQIERKTQDRIVKFFQNELDYIKKFEGKPYAPEIIDIKDINHDNKVVFGCTVKLNDLETDEKKVFKIVGHEEADIENNLLSYKSPVAKELIGKVINDFVMVNTPKGEKSYEITAIIYK